MNLQAPQPPATRADALNRLAACRDRLGQQYASRRNFDIGSETTGDRHSSVSQLSPYIRRRLITEPEVMAAALSVHGPEQAQIFLQEVLWRSYFKGWLEHRPTIWTSYRTGLSRDIAMLSQQAELADHIARAEAGETGLACFDAWAQELRDTGYLHNHARMWFASIWIFVFALPWRLGADFFLRHLLDGDPASNTCSWRWVAGLHTPGKTYVAQAWNIAKFTNDRFTPTPQDLAQTLTDLTHEEPEGLPPVASLRVPTPPDQTAPTALLLTEEDCSLGDFFGDADCAAAINLAGAACLPASRMRSPRSVSDLVIRFESRALSDCAARLALEAPPLEASHPEALINWAKGLGARQIATPYLTQGPLADALAEARPHLTAAGITLAEWQRPWDQLVWPHCTAGFFKVKKKMPTLLQQAALI